MPSRLPLLLLLAPFVLGACAGSRPGAWSALPPEPEVERPAAPPPRPTYTLAPTFGENRGYLPWPADGTVIGLFGPRVEPEHGTRTFSPGLDLATAPGTEVRAVFRGTVERVGAMAAYGTYVMVSHGGFTTVYGNLSAIGVAAGERIETGQPLGRAGTASERRGAGLFFALFEGETAVDPLGWLAPR